jgi:hypothetical protein
MDYLEYLKEQLSPQDFEIVKNLNLNLDSKDLAEMWQTTLILKRDGK